MSRPTGRYLTCSGKWLKVHRFAQGQSGRQEGGGENQTAPPVINGQINQIKQVSYYTVGGTACHSMALPFVLAHLYSNLYLTKTSFEYLVRDVTLYLNIAVNNHLLIGCLYSIVWL